MNLNKTYLISGKSLIYPLFCLMPKLTKTLRAMRPWVTSPPEMVLKLSFTFQCLMLSDSRIYMQFLFYSNDFHL